MSRTVIDLDDELLAAVARTLGTSTKTETVNTALRDHVAPSGRLEAARKLAARGARGEFDAAAAAHQAARRARRAGAGRE
ncbi:type II toxin-antitoxin system VapB family antitoxin [Streptomyces yaizuensis]|uniref:Type II toxin-antitoxin system VapB family antitoxin n=1 Tax=Streptomyces yaizuensis TaxID=2989713 RepID=A0ABQ5NUK8_9ACTN|nr:type II toxin-antitoxin system VapB family antitoxin [Streptomyces sp. YSPA8]GLF93833.1 type II toxin-antitoxin system VapB family antitoxin [Streptomyces sp. YSPA8]